MGRKCNDASGPFNFRGCNLKAEWLLAREHVRVRFPATAPAFARNEARTMAVASKRITQRRTFTNWCRATAWQANSDKSRTSLCSRVSKTQLAWGSTRAACQFSRGRGRQAMHLPCKQADVGALPTDSTNFNSLRETRPMHREKPHKLLQVGVTPTPATSFREVFRLPDCKSGVAK